ncbi:MAG: hypothetical protein KTR35_13950 [Gammaproteobacteria bacterium]|nr:hypothetical protein [Gammaproteobacteria bacterium]
MAEKFPDEVVVALHSAGVTVTCVPIRMDDGDWQAGIFYVIAPEAPCLQHDLAELAPFDVTVEADLLEHENATLVELKFEVATPGAPIEGSVLFITGHSTSHFDVLKMLSEQETVPLIFGDQYCTQLWKQRIVLVEQHREALTEILNEAVARDAMIRLTGRYDPEAAFADSVTVATFVPVKPSDSLPTDIP